MSFKPDIAAARILIVDDQDSNVHLLQRMLAESGYTDVQTMRDPTQVCAMHREQAFDLILLDLQMPVMDGFAVMAALQTNEHEGYLPVIVLTAQPAQKLRALQAGAKDFISKPFDLLEVKTRIHNMLEVRLLYRKLQDYNRELEREVADRTAALRESEARFRSLTELATDWYWEQDAQGQLVKVSGPVLEMLGIRVAPLQAVPPDAAGEPFDMADEGWNPDERRQLQAHIAARRPFLDFVFHRARDRGPPQAFRVSGQPMFDQSCRFLGYRGIGVEIDAAA